MTDFTIIVAGAAGEGIQTIGAVVQRAVAASGLPVFSWQEFESRIRGGNSSFTIRICDAHTSSPCHATDLLLALNDRALAHYAGRLKPGGTVVAQGHAPDNSGGVVRIDFGGIAERDYGSRLYGNSVATGYLASLVGLDLSVVRKALGASLSGKDEKVVSANLAAASAGYALAGGGGGRNGFAGRDAQGKGWLLTGHEALAAGAAAAGLDFIAAYPMSPSTSIITFLAEHSGELGVLVVQAEDEIAAANMAIGANFAGARAMTSTSGGGFALMVEALSLAGMTETPLVVVLAQRPGPATGLPTRTAQGDLNFAINAGHGEFPKAVLAPGDAKGAYLCAARAFELAERFQTPVVILTDQFLADSTFLVDDLPEPPIRPHNLADPEAVSTPYARYSLTESGISPRLFPGQSEHLVAADSDEHNEEGHITEDLTHTAMEMSAKRLRKTQALKEAMSPPLHEGSPTPELTLVGWGSTLHALREAVARLCESGRSASLLHFSEIWPVPAFKAPPGSRLVSVESNSTGQFERLLRAECGLAFARPVRRSDGLPIDAAYILKNLEDMP